MAKRIDQRDNGPYLNRGVEYERLAAASKELDKFEIDTKIYTEEPVYRKRDVTSDSISNPSP